MKKYKFCSANEAMQHAPNRLRFFSFGWGWCWIFIFILLICSDFDHLKFLMCSSICSQCGHTFIPFVSPKVVLFSPIQARERGGNPFFFLENKFFYFEESPKLQFCFQELIKMAPCKSLGGTPQLINTNLNKQVPQFFFFLWGVLDFWCSQCTPTLFPKCSLRCCQQHLTLSHNLWPKSSAWNLYS